MTSAQGQWWRRLHNWADVIHADFQTVISPVQQNISTYPFCTAERMLRTVIMQSSRLIQACFPIKIDQVWIERLCVRYDWWRRLQRTSSVSPVCIPMLLLWKNELVIIDIYIPKCMCITTVDVLSNQWVTAVCQYKLLLQYVNISICIHVIRDMLITVVGSVDKQRCQGNYIFILGWIYLHSQIWTMRPFKFGAA